MTGQETQTKKLFLKAKKKEKSDNSQKWNVLIVDDEKDIHLITKNALSNFVYNNRKLNFISCYSAREAEELLSTKNDISIILLDVVMEHKSAGLDLVNYIRRLIKNEIVQIILRTGHPGEVPEKDVIEEYEINDYKTKTELTQNKLLTTVRTGLRTYEALIKIKEANKELQGLDVAKNNFLKLISHEIRTPLNGIMGPIEVLKDTSNDNPEFVMFIDMLRVSVNRLFKLSETALFITEIQIRNKLNKEELELSDIIDECVIKNSEQANIKGITVSRNPDQENYSIIVDKNLVVRALSSIINNAIKYSDNQSDVLIKTSEQNGEIFIECMDNGRGFSSESLLNLFKPFGIGEQHYDNNCGLDLKVAKQIMELHSGNIIVKNREGGGASVSLIFGKE